MIYMFLPFSKAHPQKADAASFGTVCLICALCACSQPAFTLYALDVASGPMMPVHVGKKNYDLQMHACMDA